MLFELVSRRYLHKSTIVTTNKRFIDWGEVVPNAACVVSLVDRLMHRAEVIRIEGESYRAKDAEARDAQRRAERATALDTRAGVGCKRMPAGRARGTLACLWASSAKQRRGQQRQTAAEQGRHGIKRHRQCNLVVSSNRPRSSALNADTQQLQTIDEHPHVRPEGVDRRRDRPDPAPQCRRAAQPMHDDHQTSTGTIWRQYRSAIRPVKAMRPTSTQRARVIRARRPAPAATAAVAAVAATAAVTAHPLGGRQSCSRSQMRCASIISR